MDGEMTPASRGSIEARSVDSLRISTILEEVEEADCQRRRAIRELEECRLKLEGMPDAPHAAGTVAEALEERERLGAEKDSLSRRLETLREKEAETDQRLQRLLEQAVSEGLPEGTWLLQGEYGVYLEPPESAEDVHRLYVALWGVLRLHKGKKPGDIKRLSLEEEAARKLPRRHWPLIGAAGQGRSCIAREAGEGDYFSGNLVAAVPYLFFGGIAVQCFYNIAFEGTVFWLFKLTLVICLIPVAVLIWHLRVESLMQKELRNGCLKTRSIRIPSESSASKHAAAADSDSGAEKDSRPTKPERGERVGNEYRDQQE